MSRLDTPGSVRMKARAARTSTTARSVRRAPARRGDAEVDIGERLKAIRSRHALSQRALAKRAGVTNGIISMIEQNRSSPSVATLKKILDGFGMSLADFFGADRPVQDHTFYRASDLVEIGGGLLSYRQLGANLRGKAIQILHERIQPSADTGPGMLHHESEEGGIVVRGEVELTVGAQTRVLRAGEGYYFDSRTPHRFRNLGQEPCEIVSACSPPSF
jgi:transcriptional regulator with XRE-family HTH domain